MTPDQITALRALHEQATKGSTATATFRIGTEGKRSYYCTRIDALDIEAYGDSIEDAQNNFKYMLQDVARHRIFAALPALLDELERLRALTSTRSTP